MPLMAEYARRFGIFDNMQPVLSMALGAGETTVLRMAAGYSMFANGGKEVKPTLIDRIQDRYGKTIFRHDARHLRRLRRRAGTARRAEDHRQRRAGARSDDRLSDHLDDGGRRQARHRHGGPGRQQPLAGKTGTTNDYHDAWFVGFSPDLVAGVFVGYDKPRSLGHAETGGGLAAPIFPDFMKTALADKPPSRSACRRGSTSSRSTADRPARQPGRSGHHSRSLQAGHRAAGHLFDHRLHRPAGPAADGGAGNRPGGDFGHRRALLAGQEVRPPKNGGPTFCRRRNPLIRHDRPRQ